MTVTRKTVPERTKFEIITWLKAQPTAELTAEELLYTINADWNLDIIITTFYGWLKNFEIPYKKRRNNGMNASQVEALTHEIATLTRKNAVLCNAIKHLYYQLNIPVPDQLKRITQTEEENTPNE